MSPRERWKILQWCVSLLPVFKLPSRAGWLKSDVLFQASAVKVCKRAMKKYASTRPKASAESVRRAKDLLLHIGTLTPHPIFGGSNIHCVEGFSGPSSRLSIV